jgi:hypothetical protein
MGQAYDICNLDRKEYLSGYWFGYGNHLADLARPRDSTMVALAVLLVASGTDFHRGGPLYGRWAGDRIAIVGEYYMGKVGPLGLTDDVHTDIFNQANGWIDISEHVRVLLEREWHIDFPPPLLDGTERRSVLHADGTLTLLPVEHRN